MDRQLVHLGRDELDRVITIEADGSVTADTDVLANAISRALGVLGVRVALAALDYLQHEDRTPEADTRSASGIWWKSHGNDTALIGGFIIDGHAMTMTTEGEGESPLAESDEIVDRATRAIASQYQGAEIVGTGLINIPGPSGGKAARVVVTRDYRVRRPQDVLGRDEVLKYDGDHLGLAIVQVIGGEKALVIKHGV